VWRSFLDHPDLSPIESISPQSDWGLDESELTLLRRVVGGIHRQSSQHFWRAELDAAPFILKWLKHGYSLEFPEGPPPPSKLPNNASARSQENREFISAALHDLEAAGAISRVDYKPHLVLPLQVAEPRGKKRIIVDASRQLNDFLPDGKVKLDHLQKVVPNIPQGAWLSSLDLKSGYYHVRMRATDRKFLGVKWENRYFVWNVTFLGLRPLVRDFTKLMKPLMAYLSRRGLHIYV